VKGTLGIATTDGAAGATADVTASGAATTAAGNAGVAASGCDGVALGVTLDIEAATPLVGAVGGATRVPELPSL